MEIGYTGYKNIFLNLDDVLITGFHPTYNWFPLDYLNIQRQMYYPEFQTNKLITKFLELVISYYLF